MLSDMSQHIKMGYNLDFDYFSEEHYQFSLPTTHWKILQNFQKDLGTNALKTFAYQKDFRKKWDVTDHFCEQVIGLKGLETQPTNKHTNEHLDAQAAQLISEMHYLKPRLNQFTGEWLQSNYQNVTDFSKHLPQMKNKPSVPSSLVGKIEKQSKRILEAYRDQWGIKFPEYHYVTKQFNQHRFTKEYVWEMFKKLESTQVIKKRSEETGQQSDVFLSNEFTKNLAIFFYNSLDKRPDNSKITEPTNNITGVFERNTVCFGDSSKHI